MRSVNVLVVGEALVDVVRDGSALVREHVGGSPLNVAVGLARLGVAATLAAHVGVDRRGQAVRDHLAASGVALEAVGPPGVPTSTAVASLSAGGAATYELDVDWNPTFLPDPSRFDMLHVGSIGTVLPSGANLVRALAEEAAARAIPVSLDPNVRLSIQPDPSVWRQTFDLLRPAVSHLKMSDEDAAVLFPGASAQLVADTLASEGRGRLVALTHGADGAYVASPAGAAQVVARSSEVVDTIGAGDAFTAAMLTWSGRRAWPAPGMLDSADLEDVANFASHAASITCSRKGADPPWSHEMVEPTRAATPVRGSRPPGSSAGIR
ncbi:PfkB family carbohydrate kinase [Aeromicrobium terrae]|uniref:PfkB family carbohydrate kinase n=1 Tax=Aeromicrobium terrae TaxID=2498846 RepID=UPI002EDB1CF4